MTTPQAISEIVDPDPIRVKIYASNMDAHAPLVEAVRAGANGRLLPAGGDEGDVLTKASGTDYDVQWSKSIGLRAWANIAGGVTPSIREQFNVESVSRTGIGDYTAFWTDSISSTASITITAGDTTTPAVYVANIVSIDTTSCRFQIRTHLNALVDCDTIGIHVAGNFTDFLLLSGDMQATGDDKLSLDGDMAPGVLKLSED